MSNHGTIGEIDEALTQIRALRKSIKERRKKAKANGNLDLARRLRKEDERLSKRLFALAAVKGKHLRKPSVIRGIAKKISSAATQAKNAVNQLKKIADIVDHIASVLGYADRLLKLVA